MEPNKPRIITPTAAELSQLNLITSTEASKSKTVYVVVSADKSTVMKNPGLDEPYNTTNRKAAEAVAREAGGHCVPLREAIHLIFQHPKNY